MLTILFTAFLAVAMAQPIDDDVPEEDLELDIPEQGHTQKSDDHGFTVDSVEFDVDGAVEDDAGMVDFVAQKRKQAPPPTWFHLDASGKQPLGDDWDIELVAHDEQYLLVRLPVLIATDPATFAQSWPKGLQLKALVRAGSESVALEQTVVGAFKGAPTWTFLEAAVPVAGPTAEVKFDVWIVEPTETGDPKPVAQLKRARTLSRK